MSDPELLIVLGACACAAVLCVLLLRQVILLAPVKDARWRDKPPLLWRVSGPLVRGLAASIEPLLPARLSRQSSALLRQAGLDAAMTPAELIAGQMLAATALAVAVWWVIPDGLIGTDPIRSANTSGYSSGYSSGATAGNTAGNPWSMPAVMLAASLGAIWPLAWIREHRAKRLRHIYRSLPFYLDIVTLSVESGTNLTGALSHAVAKGPAGPLQAELERVLSDVRAGRTRAEALRALAERIDLPAIASWVAALVSAERQGSSLGPILRAQAEQRRQERFQLAEKLAMRAPVKMLFPLLVFIFPCTFVLLLFPVAVRLLEEGLLR
jgi:tight adherence protein C